MQYSIDNGATWSVASSVTTTWPRPLACPLSWAASTGHAVDDEWRFNAYPPAAVAQNIPTQIFSDGAAATDFGLGSTAQLMARAVMQRNPYVDLTVITLDDASGVAARGP